MDGSATLGLDFNYMTHVTYFMESSRVNIEVYLHVCYNFIFVICFSQHCLLTTNLSIHLKNHCLQTIYIVKIIYLVQAFFKSNLRFG
jgi:hypothetical protein